MWIYETFHVFSRRDISEFAFSMYELVRESYSTTILKELHFDDSKRTTLRLAFPNKSTVHKVHCSQMTGLTDASLLDYTRMCRVWKTTLEFRQIKSATYKPTFSKCHTRKMYNTKNQKQMSEAKILLLDGKHILYVE